MASEYWSFNFHHDDALDICVVGFTEKMRKVCRFIGEKILLAIGITFLHHPMNYHKATPNRIHLLQLSFSLRVCLRQFLLMSFFHSLFFINDFFLINCTFFRINDLLLRGLRASKTNYNRRGQKTQNQIVKIAKNRQAGALLGYRLSVLSAKYAWCVVWTTIVKSYPLLMRFIFQIETCIRLD